MRPINSLEKDCFTRALSSSWRRISSDANAIAYAAFRVREMRPPRSAAATWSWRRISLADMRFWLSDSITVVGGRDQSTEARRNGRAEPFEAQDNEPRSKGASPVAGFSRGRFFRGAA